MKNSIYLDYAATTPVLPEVLEEMLPFFTMSYGNPSGVYSTAREAHQAVEKARRRVAMAIGAEPGEIYFTSGGSESHNMAIQNIRNFPNAHIFTSAIEHHAVLNTCRQMEKEGIHVTYLPVNQDGIVDPDTVLEAITRTIEKQGEKHRIQNMLISVMTANNEIGTIEPIPEIGRIAAEYHIPFHTDAVQAAGSVPINVNDMRVDMLSISAHKFYGPKGVGALYIRRGTRMNGLIHGGAQERSLRAGTENTAGIVGMGKAIEIATREMQNNSLKIRNLREMMIREVLNKIPGSTVNGSLINRLDNNCHFSFSDIDGEALLLRLDLAGIAASGGSACTSGNREPSHVLQAIGLDEKRIKGSIRFTLGRNTTSEEIEQAVHVMRAIVEDLRKT